MSLQASVEPDDEIEIVIDRRRARALFDSNGLAAGPHPDHRRNLDVDLAVRTKGFAIVSAEPKPIPGWREPAEPDREDDRARFGNVLSFTRAR